MLKKVLKFILILFPWFLSSLICRDYSYYNLVNKPCFALPNYLFPIIWPILYILIAISIFIIFKDYVSKDYKKNLLYNFIFNQLYTIIFFCFKNPFLAFIDVLLTLLTSLFLYYETKELKKSASILLIPYVIFLLYALILSISIYFMNL